MHPLLLVFVYIYTHIYTYTQNHINGLPCTLRRSAVCAGPAAQANRWPQVWTMLWAWAHHVEIFYACVSICVYIIFI